MIQIETVATFVNEQKRHTENMSRLVEIQTRMTGAPDDLMIIKPDRRLIRISISTLLAHTIVRLNAHVCACVCV